MKNQIIKKIMAYLLVGAMVITTPMTASAAGLADAYDTGTGSDEESNSDKQTNTSTNTSTDTSAVPIPTEIPEIIEKHGFNILGIQFDKDTLDLEAGEKDSLHVRILLDDYDANDEELAWKALSAEDRLAIESQIHWISKDPSVATAKVAAKDGGKSTDGIIEAIGNGETTVLAWIEADGFAYENAPNMPTKDDWIAEATVTVRGEKPEISFDDLNLVNQKRTYDLRKLTNIHYKKGTIKADETNEKVYYTVTPVSGTTAKATCKDNLFTITKTASSTESNNSFLITAVSEDGQVANGVIKLSKTPVAAEYTQDSHVGLDYADEDSVVTKLDIANKTETTDDFEWKVKNTKIVDVSPSRDGRSATVVAKGVGTTDITVKSTSESKARTIKVFVNATPKVVTFTADGGRTYTGRPISTKATVTGENGKKLPESAFTYTWSPKAGTVNATIKKVGKLNEAKITPKNVLNGGNIPESQEVEFGYTCKLSYKQYSWDASRKKVITTSAKNKELQAVDSGTITIKQSNIADITIDEKLLVSKENGIQPEITEIIGKLPSTKSNTRKTYIGKDYQYAATAYVINGLKTTIRPEDQKDLDNSISWSVSGKAATIDENGKLTLTAGGKSTITASYISLKYKNGKATAQVKKKTIPLQIIQNATSIGFQKPVVVVNPGNRAASVKFKISNVAPKKATYNITSWKVIAVDENGNDITGNITEEGYKKDATGITIDAKDKNGNYRKDAKITVPTALKAGSVIKIAAYTDGGVMATGYIYVTNKTTEVSADAISVKLGETRKIEPKINRTNSTEAWIEGAKKEDGKPVSSAWEFVTYSLDKTAAQYIRVDRNGNIIPLKVTKPAGVKVTIKTLSGKSGKVTIKVLPQSSAQ